jgi:ABC-2 type transport system permease protein
MPTYREAQQFSAIFIILSILPIYVASALVAEPAGLLARVFSYFPFTAPLVLLFRSSIDALPGWEVGVGMTVMLLYICAGLLFAFKLFELGSLELTKKISLSSILRSRK